MNEAVWTALISSLAAAAASILTVVFGHLSRERNNQRKSQVEEMNVRFEQLTKERAELAEAYASLRRDLMSQILELRQTQLKLQEDNTRYAVENAELKAKVRVLEDEIAELKAELDQERKDRLACERHQE